MVGIVKRTGGHGQKNCEVDDNIQPLTSKSQCGSPVCPRTGRWHRTVQHPGVCAYEEQGLSRYLEASEELLRATKEENVLTEWNDETDTQHKDRIRKKHKNEQVTEQLHGELLRQTRDMTERAGH